MRAARVELASSWSASRMRAASRARARAGLGATRATLGHRRAARRGGRPARPVASRPRRRRGRGAARRIGGRASTRVASSVRAWWVTDSARRSTRRGRDDATAAVPTRMRSAGVTAGAQGRGDVAHQGDVLGRGRPAGPVGQLAGPQQLGHVLEGGRGHQLDGVVSPVAQLTVADLGQRGGQDHVHDAGAAGVGPGSAAPGQGLDLGRDRSGWCVRRRPSGAAAGPG